MKELYQELGISEKVFQYGAQFQEKLKERFAQIDETAEYNQLKVLRAMQRHKVSAECFMGSSGYGYNDQGRRKAEKNLEFSPLLPDTDNAGVGRLCDKRKVRLLLLSNIIGRLAYLQAVFLRY